VAIQIALTLRYDSVLKMVEGKRFGGAVLGLQINLIVVAMRNMRHIVEKLAIVVMYALIRR